MAEGKKADSDKARVDLIPPHVILGISNVLTYGANKYGDRNWEAGIQYSRIYAACMRHLLAFWGGYDFDMESHYHHLAHAACCIVFLMHYVHSERYREWDDRPEKKGPE